MSTFLGISRKTFTLLTQVKRAGSFSSFRVDHSGNDGLCSSNCGSMKERLRNHGGHGSGSSTRGPQLALPCLQLPRCSESESYSVMSDSLQPHGIYSPWNSPGLFHSAGDLPNLRIKPRILHQLSRKGSLCCIANSNPVFS